MSRIYGLLVLFFTLIPLPAASQTRVLFDPASPGSGPFPSNLLTTPDPTQTTGLRISLPPAFSTCAPGTSAPVCSNTGLLNQLDGFSVNPRIMVCFSAPVDPATLKQGIRLTRAGKSDFVGINQIVFDSASNCAFAKPDRLLPQSTQYVLTVTDAVRDTEGNAVSASPSFTECAAGGSAYCVNLAKALGKTPLPAGRLTGASLFTTLSATTWMEQARKYVAETQPPVVLPAGLPFAFPVSALQSIVWTPQDNSGTTVNQVEIPLNALDGVGTIAFGLFLSPNFLNPADGSIPQTPTGAFTSSPIALPGIGPYLPVAFNLFLPATPAPKNGYPVVIYGHGLSDNRFGAPTFIAATLAKKGFATLAFEITGHGYGPLSTVQVTDKPGFRTTLLAPGRGIQLNPSSPVIGPTDGCVAKALAIAVRDCGRQTAIDLFALVRTIQLTGGLLRALDPAQIYYIGQSFGGTYGALMLAAEPSVRAAVFSAVGGTSVDVARLSMTGRPLAASYLDSQGLLNDPNKYFEDNYPFRDAPPVTQLAPGAAAIQASFEAADWLGMVGDPVSFAPRMLKMPLFQFGLGDLEVPNPTESAVIRAAGGEAKSWYFRYDRAVPFHPELAGVTMPGVAPLPILPHRILANPTIMAVDSERTLSLALQQQAADYLRTNGTSTADPNQWVPTGFMPAGMKLFEIPAALPETLNYPW